MKKILFRLVIASSIDLMSMEKDLQLFPWEQLPLELKTEVINAINVQSAIDVFKKLRATSKQYNTEQAITGFLDSVNTKSPVQEVRITRALNNHYAQEWLEKKKPGFPYKPITEIKYDNPQGGEFRNLLYHKANQVAYGTAQEKQDFLAQIEKGLDPNVIYKSTAFGGIFKDDKNLEIVKKLVAYGLDLRGSFSEKFYHYGSNLQNTHSMPITILTFASNYSCSKKIYEYLKREGAE